MRYRLLVVDGDPRSLRVLDVSLRNAGFDVDTAVDGTEAWAKLEAGLPDLVIADTDLQGIDGFELCARLRNRAGGGQIPFIFLATEQGLDKKIRGLQAGADDYLVKPAYIKEVLSRVGARLQRRERDRLIEGEGPPAVPSAGTGDGSGVAKRETFAGDLADITVVDLIQLVEGQGRSGIIHLRRDANTPGSIYFRQGKVVDAEVGQLSGVDALLRLFAWTSGAFEFEWRNIRRKDVIERPPAALVIEGMKKLDERNQLRGAFPDQTAVYAVDYQLLAERLAEIPDEMNAVLRLCDGVRTVGQVVEECALPDVEAWNALVRLRDEGIVFDVEGGSTRGPEQERSGAALSADSGPVHRSFAASLAADEDRGNEADGGGEGAADGGPEVPAVVPERRRTAPGLGHGTIVLPAVVPPAGPGDAVQEAGIPEARLEPGAGKIIAFPLSSSEPPHVSGSPRRDEHSVSPGEGTSATALLPDASIATSPGDAPGADEGASPSPEPRSPATMSRTQRGFGPGFASGSYAPDSAIPVEVSDRRSSGPAESAGLHGSAPTTVAGSGPSRPVPAGSKQRSGSGRTSAGTASDATERIAYKDNDITDRDALDELGLPSRWRLVRFLAAALVVGALGAVIASRVRVASRVRAAADARDVPAGGHTQTDAVGEATGGAAAVLPAAAAPEGAVGTVVTGAHAGTGSSAQALADAASAPLGQAVAGAAATATAAHAEAPPASSAGNAPAATAPAAADPVPGAVAPGAIDLPSSAHTQPAAAPVVVPVTPAAAPAAPPKDAARQLSECRTAFARDRFREAVSACNAAVAANPRSAEALTMLAHAELNRGRLSRAGELAEKALALDPEMADAYVIVGGVHQDSGQNSEAKAAYRRYLQLSPRGRYADELRSIVNGL